MRRPLSGPRAYALIALLAASSLLTPVTALGGTASTVPSGMVVRSPAPGVTDPNDQPPAGADDGMPVGGDDRPHGRIGPVTAASPQAASGSSTRYFGDGPWAAIGSVADTTAKCAGLDRYQLQAMMVAPIFKESSGGSSPSSAPAPMTLSRYDEWSGVMADNSNSNANYGLYAFRDPYTPFARAFWHPGIGIWQYDSAGVGAPFTAAERMDVADVGVDVAAGMRDAWCDPSAWINHGPPYTDAERRAAAWAPWWYLDNGGCPLCEQAYADMTPTAPTSRFQNIGLVPMSVAGGAVLRNCRLAGAGSYPCWYVDPGMAQGSSWWAALTPLDGGSPTQAPTPISTPFYVIKRDGLEQRYWLRADTGYAGDLTGTRVLGKNARPRSSQPGSGISWSMGAGLCDVTAGRGSCDPNVPPPGVISTQLVVNGTYRPVPLEVNGDGRGDVLFYAPGTATDHLWIGLGSGRFRSVTLPAVNVDYQVLATDVDGDRLDDLVFYHPGTGTLSLWRSNGDGSFRTTSYRATPGVTLHALDRNGNGQHELLLYGVGAVPDSFWEWNGATFTAVPETVNGDYQVRIGDFDGNGRDDILWYTPGLGGDSLWMHSIAGGRTVISFAVNSTYQVMSGDVDGDGRSDVVWYQDRPGDDWVWFGGAGARFVHTKFAVGSGYQPVMVDLPHDGRQDVMWYAAGSAPDLWSRWSADRTLTTSPAKLAGTQQPIVGRFSAGGDGIIWYGRGTVSDSIWWQ